MNKENKLEFFIPKKENGLGQWLAKEGISAGFPSPADDFKETRISLDRELVKNKEATFYARVSGDSMVGAGLDDGDLLCKPLIGDGDASVTVDLESSEAVGERDRTESFSSSFLENARASLRLR